MNKRFDSQKENRKVCDVFVLDAVAYCKIIESYQRTKPRVFVKRVHKALSSLYSNALNLPDSPDNEEAASAQIALSMAYVNMTMQKLLYSKGIEPKNRTKQLIGMSFNEWKTMYSSLKKKLRNYDTYYSLDNPLSAKDNSRTRASMADELIDIYRSLNDGMSLWDRGQKDGVNGAWFRWHHSFDTHWGSSCVRLMTALHSAVYGE